MRVPVRSITVSILFACTISPYFAFAALPSENNFWPQFRGPKGQSVASGQTLPTNFGPNKNVRWKTAIPEGHSSPAIWENHLFLTAYEDLKLIMLCIRRSDGKTIWKDERPIKELQRYSHKDSSPSAPTPCTDGERVAFLFGDYGLIVFDMDGKLIWEKKFLPSSSDFGYGASPALIDGKLLINCDGGIRAGLLCLDFASGDELWFAERPETIISYSTPYIWSHGNQTEVLQAGTSRLSSYNLADGAPLWHVTNLPGFVCPTPIASEDRVFFGAWTTSHVTGSTRIQSLFSEEHQLTPEQLSSPGAFYERFDTNRDRKLSVDELPPSRARDAFNFIDVDASGFLEFDEFAPAFKNDPSALRAGRNVLVSVAAGGKGEITQSHVRWETRKALPYVASPLLYENRLYYVKKGGYLSCVDPASGVPFYESEKLGVSGEYFASPIGIDSKVIVASQGGIITILSASPKFEILSTVDIGEAILSSPAMVDNHLYLRSQNHLWAFGE